jgi:type IV pilus biogenesis protein CpaD/CtpE
MVRFESKTLLQTKRIFAVLSLSAVLAGCALDDFARDETFQPYGGSKLHPIKVADGRASVDKCGDWSENAADTLENTQSANHGCAVQANIAAMVAYPNDLVHARRMSRSPAFARTSPISGMGGSTGGGTSDSTAPKP